ncbi:MAG: bifunctional 4-hydroxy-3-methylbut-2-enyl diphosphate reductase/30S ribosomal protein S1 [Clostridia bacterium]|nr:bifunctional 4-hydroxy-3-methylbut-2-enyl diphosphate reductase/30S ribosomal protein S1 [Clostridia bacterium]
MIFRAGDKTITLAETAGFCFGVKRAIDIALESAPAASLGPLIHNDEAVAHLAEKGIRVIDSLDDVAEPGGTDASGGRGRLPVIIRSHGEGKATYEEAKVKGIELIDATCPFVEKIHKIVRETDRQVVIAGDPNHAEVKGIAGWCAEERPAIVCRSAEEAVSPLQEGGKVLLVAQTTIKEETFEEVARALDEAGCDVEKRNTICSATSRRQEECDRLARENELMIVIGGKGSSNTRKLFEIASKHCKSTYFVENLEDLPLHEVVKCNKIGVVAGASTPDYTIKEVIANMSDVTLENKDMTMEELLQSEEFNKTLKLPRNGEIVDGKVHQVNNEEVIVNLGVKKDGILQKSEASLEEGQTLADAYKVGDEIKAKVIKTDDGDGGILLSTKKLEYIANWEEVVKAYEDKSVIEVKVTRAVRGGVIAEYKEFSGFIPLSQLSDHFVVDAEEFVGQTMNVRVFRIDPAKTKAVFSHKMYLVDERKKLIQEIWEKLHVDDVVEGTVMRFTNYGAFVDIGGIDGLLHISEISWGKLKHPQEVLSIGEKINVKILSMNEEKEKISLGLKQNTPEPWSVIDEKYEVGQVIEGKVVQIKEYGAFVELEPGLDGLVHISEVAHKRVENINNELQVGQVVNVKILEIDKDRKRISLSIRETIDPPTPEEIAAEKAAAEAAKAAAEAEAPVEEAPAEEPAVEEAPVEEPAAEEAPAEEVPAEEPAVEEAPAEAPAEEA